MGFGRTAGVGGDQDHAASGAAAPARGVAETRKLRGPSSLGPGPRRAEEMTVPRGRGTRLVGGSAARTALDDLFERGPPGLVRRWHVGEETGAQLLRRRKIRARRKVQSSGKDAGSGPARGVRGLRGRVP